MNRVQKLTKLKEQLNWQDKRDQYSWVSFINMFLGHVQVLSIDIVLQTQVNPNQILIYSPD